MNGWGEAFNSMNDGNLMWFGMALWEQNIPMIKKWTKLMFNRYPGFEFLAWKKELSIILSRMSRYFPNDFVYVPWEFILPEETEELKRACDEDSK